MPSWSSLTVGLTLGLGTTFLRDLEPKVLDAGAVWKDLETKEHEPSPVLEPLEFEPVDARRGWSSQAIGFAFLSVAVDVGLVLACLRMRRKARAPLGPAAQGPAAAPPAVPECRLPCHPECFEIYSEDEAVESSCEDERESQLVEALKKIHALEAELREEKEKNAVLEEGQADAYAVLQAELQVSQKELIECQGEANVMRVQLEALSQMRRAQVPCASCMGAVADWLKASIRDMAVQPHLSMEPWEPELRHRKLKWSPAQSSGEQMG